MSEQNRNKAWSFKRADSRGGRPETKSKSDKNGNERDRGRAGSRRGEPCGGSFSRSAHLGELLGVAVGHGEPPGYSFMSLGQGEVLGLQLSIMWSGQCGEGGVGLLASLQTACGVTQDISILVSPHSCLHLTLSLQ